MDIINTTEVQYVRCIKPNMNKSNTEFNRPMVRNFSCYPLVPYTTLW